MGGCFSSLTVEELNHFFLNAVKRNDVDQVLRLIESGADVNAIDNEGKVPLMTAAQFGYVDCLEVLLKHGANVDASKVAGEPTYEDLAYPHVSHQLRKNSDAVGDTTLIRVARSGNADCLKLLLAYGADVNASNVDGDTALIGAAFYGKVSCLECLLKNGATVNATNSDGETALMRGALNDRVEVLDLLLEHGANVNAADSDGETALMNGARRDRVELLELLLNHGANVNATNSDGETALMWAAERWYPNCFECLLKNGANVNAADSEGETALMRGARRDRVELLELLLNHGANVNAANSDGETALMLAAKKGYPNCFECLLKNGANVNAADSEGETALMRGARRDRVELLELLLNHGANVNAANSDGETALMLAAKKGYPNCLECLLKNGANVNATSSDGETALMRAAEEGYADCLACLLKNGANVNATADNRKTALMMAASNRRLSCLRMLCNHAGANWNVERLRDALNVAEIEETQQILRYYINKLEEPQQKPQMETSPSVPPPPPSTPSHLDSFPLNSSDSSIPAPSAPFMTTPVPTAPVQNQSGGDISHQNWAISFEELQLGNMIGRGSYAEVYRAAWHGTEVAAKRFTFPSGSTESEAQFSAALLNKIKIEADLLASVRHPHVVAFLAMCTEPPCLVTELCSGGSLFDTIKRSKTDAVAAAKLSWDRRLSMLIDAAAGMSHLHQRKPPILHRDLKSLNLLVDSAWRVKVADLGLSKLMEDVAAETHAGSTASTMNARWLAPEVLETGKWLTASDVYSFGVVMWELLTWELPWTHINQFMVRNNVY
jgi:ankyrin repeat protein